jgi:hypothetical protein
MNQRHFPLLIITSLVFSLLPSCSQEKVEKPKETISQQTEKIGQQAVQAIKSPIDQAKVASGQQTNHNQRVEEQSKQQ